MSLKIAVVVCITLLVFVGAMLLHVMLQPKMRNQVIVLPQEIASSTLLSSPQAVFQTQSTNTPTGTPQLDACASAKTQQDANNCYHAEFLKSDGRLNATYQNLLSKLSLRDKNALGKAEEAWIAFRDADCDFAVLTYQGGTAEPMIRSICLKGLTDSRQAELQELMKTP